MVTQQCRLKHYRANLLTFRFVWSHKILKPSGLKCCTWKATSRGMSATHCYAKCVQMCCQDDLSLVGAWFANWPVHSLVYGDFPPSSWFHWLVSGPFSASAMRWTVCGACMCCGKAIPPGTCGKGQWYVFIQWLPAAYFRKMYLPSTSTGFFLFQLWQKLVVFEDEWALV